eukprot:COSAG02_NODE_3619_length_6464_cov_15.210683_11_plen_69_part_00
MPGEDIAAENRREAAARKVARRAVPRISQKRRNLGIMYGLCGLFFCPCCCCFFLLFSDLGAVGKARTA